MTIEYNVATIEDIDSLLDIEETCFTGYYRKHRFSGQQFRYYLNNPHAITIVAKKEGDIVAYILGITQHGRVKHIARIYSIAVKPAVRKTGIGGELLARFQQAAKKRGASRVTLEVAEKNTGAIILFSKCGFRETDNMPDYYGNGVNGIRMAREI